MALDKSRLSQIYEKWVQFFRHDELNITNNFSKCTTSTAKADFVNELLDKYPIDLFSARIGKDNTVSKAVRETGNVNYGKKNWNYALECYSKSVAYAEKDSQELAMALGNRAACLLNLGFIAEAFVDVSRALTVQDIDDSYRDKLNSRKDVCMTRIIETKEIPPRESVVEMKSKNLYFDSCCSKIELKENKELGRFMIATDDIRTGEVLIVEKPFSSVLLHYAFYVHCSRCFVQSPVLVECPDCASAMYCSTECLANHKNVHRFECPILEHLVHLEAGPSELLAVRILIDGCYGETPITTLTEEEPVDDMYRSSDIRRVFNLVGNGSKRSIGDLFRRGFSAAVLVRALKNFTNFFKEFPVTESEARGFILHLLQSLPCNAHEISASFKSGNLGRQEAQLQKEIGAAVYSTLSLINHSCEPNVVRHSFGDYCIIRAIRSIRQGEEIVDNYGYHYATQDKEERQQSLMRQYYFQCECEACIGNWPLYNDISLDYNGPQLSKKDSDHLENMIAKFKVQICQPGRSI